jgi:hypothetical protein
VLNKVEGGRSKERQVESKKEERKEGRKYMNK